METKDRAATTTGGAVLDDPHTRTLFGRVRALVGCYLGLSVLTMVAAVLLRDNPALVTDAVWIRGGIVVLSALLMLTFTARAARGARRAFLRVRVLSGAMVVAIAVLVALPGLFPVWMRIEQGVCGLLLLGVVALVNGRHLRTRFAG